MNYIPFSYRYSEEIIQHQRHGNAWAEIDEVIRNAPLFIFPNKSVRNRRLDAVQQLMNTYFDCVLTSRYGWEFHPLATRIADSGLTADFRKSFGNLTIQAEIQFGNMARWYSDIFKFQTAYSQSLINAALSIIPAYSLASRIDSNIVNFERTIRELPSAVLSITLPILMIGLYVDENTTIVDVSQCQFNDFNEVKIQENRCKIVNGYLEGIDMAQIGPNSPIGINPYININPTENEDN
ncbi:MAG TPA: hypothetical protein DCY27_13500 [Desulfobacterales bacterium]|nr:hypothetical protein [Desulfobacterales bacterium]